jgi:hypothetical protein
LLVANSEEGPTPILGPRGLSAQRLAGGGLLCNQTC